MFPYGSCRGALFPPPDVSAPAVVLSAVLSSKFSESAHVQFGPVENHTLHPQIGSMILFLIYLHHSSAFPPSACPQHVWLLFFVS